jgi:carboxypeptidase Q
VRPVVLTRRAPALLAALVLSASSAAAQQPSSEVERLVGSFAGDTPLARDLQQLTDEIGGRATGSPANLRAVEWALARFREAGVDARREAFPMPGLWLERSASATVRGDGVEFSPRVASMPFSTATPAAGTTAPLLDAGTGGEDDFKRLGASARGAFLLVEQVELADIDALFKEYNESAAIEQRAAAAGAAGVVYQGSRPYNTLYRHNVTIGSANTRPMLVMERDGAARAMRLLRAGKALTLTERIDLQPGGPYESFNVVGEIRGSERPEEVVVLGAHLDSWDLGTGALDNGANAAMLIDVARQMRRLGIRPRRTLRFVMWNGEEQGMVGSMGYTRAHAPEMDRHVMAASFDIGCGKITGFFTGGRPEIVEAVGRTLDPVRGLGPFTQVDVPLVGTDNFDFMLQGVANLVANQESASYGPNYHARSDDFARCDLQQLRLNAAVAAALAYGMANGPVTWTRQSRAQVEEIMRHSDLEQQMRTFNVWDEWAAGTRGRPKQ